MAGEVNGPPSLGPVGIVGFPEKLAELTLLLAEARELAGVAGIGVMVSEVALIVEELVGFPLCVPVGIMTLLERLGKPVLMLLDPVPLDSEEKVTPGLLILDVARVNESPEVLEDDKTLITEPELDKTPDRVSVPPVLVSMGMVKLSE